MWSIKVYVFIKILKCPFFLILSSQFSIIGAVRTGKYMMHIITKSGFKQSVCDNSFYNAPITKFWSYAFAISKAPELGKIPSVYFQMFCLKLDYILVFIFLMPCLVLVGQFEVEQHNGMNQFQNENISIYSGVKRAGE